MSVDAETYIVISLMFAVFAAVAAVGTSVVLGAGFERLRAGFELIKRQSGFFADAIYKLDQRTQKLDEETAKIKSGMAGVYDRMERVEKQTSFIADAVNSIEQRILQGTPSQPRPLEASFVMNPYSDLVRPQKMEAPKAPKVEINGWVLSTPVMGAPTKPSVLTEDEGVGLRGQSLMAQMFDPYDQAGDQAGMLPKETAAAVAERNEEYSPQGFTTLLSRYFQSEGGRGDKGIIYH